MNSSAIQQRLNFLGNEQLIIELIRNGADNFTAIDKDGLAVIHIASKNGHENIVGILLNHEVDVNIRDSFGNTALYHAISGGNGKISKICMRSDKLDFRLNRVDCFGSLNIYEFFVDIYFVHLNLQVTIKWLKCSLQIKSMLILETKVVAHQFLKLFQRVIKNSSKNLTNLPIFTEM